MEIDAAQDWINLIVEVSVGVYVFLISVPALIYSTFIPQELREMRDKSAFRQIKPFSGAFGYVLLIVLLASTHFFVGEFVPKCNDICDKWCNEHEPFKTWTHYSKIFSSSITISVTLIFLGLLMYVAWSSRRMKKGYLKLIAENLQKSLIEQIEKLDKVQKLFSSPLHRWYYMRMKHINALAFTQANESELWQEMVMLGKFTSPGSQKQVWLNSMEGIILHLIYTRNNNIESLKTAIKMLGDVMGDASNTATYENVKFTLDIYRALLSKLNENAEEEDSFQFTECYSAISRSLHSFALTAVKADNSGLLYSIISTMTLLPNNSSSLFEIAVMALRHSKYEILAHSFNEIIGKGEDEDIRHHNFWGIYAALYLKGGAFREHAKQMRQRSEYPLMNIRDLREAYHYHFSNAHFDMADNLYKLIKQRTKKDLPPEK